MAKRKSKHQKAKAATFSVATALVLIFSALITYFPQLGLPSWNELFVKAGLVNFIDSDDFDFSVHYIDVGQADCELIISDNNVVLIDSGDAEDYNKIKGYLDFQEIKTIDYFILTHPHSDHIGSASKIISDYEVKNVIMTRYSEANTPTTDIYKDLVISLNSSNAKVIPAAPGNSYDIGDFSFTVLSPIKEYEELNDSSVVIKAGYKNNSFLFCGDAEKKAEKDILNAGYDISADVIKLGHHGSSTSSSAKFFEAVKPEYAVISCGKNNKYNHPNQPIIDYLHENKIEYKRTDFNGTVVVSSDGETINVVSER